MILCRTIIIVRNVQELRKIAQKTILLDKLLSKTQASSLKVSKIFKKITEPPIINPLTPQNKATNNSTR
jgi:hypothetical protein